ncbi:hypothetical protein NB640_12395 [Oxalobacter vibrioformis]|uniref:Tail tubular protein A n=1 Tax=Oxalobacter vibrioformis TaxID=933080 RepID=A0A9E9LYK3_9BURK|nr:hypothetical protein [Oxalobacter vibrioformis]WAW10000.1 hypothetical protein NB640_12395 [Oxalobacter vibrioformis]
MTTTTLTTKLEAVNTLLDAIEESPVDTLESSGLVDVAKAKDTLDEVSRQVQLKGWNFNSEELFPFYPDSEGHITLPQNILKIDSLVTNTAVDLVQRGGRAYDKRNHTYIFKEPLKVNVVWLLPWDELPEAARQYIMIRASRVFQARQLGSDSQHKFSEEVEYAALTAMQQHETETGDYNILSGNWDAARILMR